MIPTVNFDFYGPADYARMYRTVGWQVVPALLPEPGKQWKRPAIPWRNLQNKIVDADSFDMMWGPQGRWRDRPNMGLLTGSCSGNTFVLDLDLYKSDAAREWWSDLLSTYNHGIEPPTPKQVTGGGGVQLFFRAPEDWLPPTNKTTIGVDIRGQGGFAMLPPSMHESGAAYSWAPGREPGLVSVQVAPEWMTDAIDDLIKRHGGGTHTGQIERTGTPDAAKDAFGFAVDNREDIMTRIVWAAVVNLYRDCPIKPAGEADMVAPWNSYLLRVKSRITEPGTPQEVLLEREGRGVTMFRQRWRAAMDQWDEKVAKHAIIAPPEREKPTSAVSYSSATDPFPRQASKSPQAPQTSQPSQSPPSATLTGASWDDESKAATPQAPQQQKEGIYAKPYQWVDPQKIPPRKWLYGYKYLRRMCAMTIAPGGLGKSAMVIVEALAMASGKPLLGVQPPGRLRVWVYNGEDPMEELQRRVQAAAKFYGLTHHDLDGYLFLTNGRDTLITIAEQTRDGTAIHVPVVEACVKTIKENKIDYWVVDPFVSSHRVMENDNNAIDRVAKMFVMIADETGCAINLVHHARKTSESEISVEDGRGAIALRDAVRTAWVLNRMSESEAEKAGVETKFRYFRVNNGKNNLALPSEKADWFKMESVYLGNGIDGEFGDSVGVVTKWEWPNAMDDVTSDHVSVVLRHLANQPRNPDGTPAFGNLRMDKRSKNWLGNYVSTILGIDMKGGIDKSAVAKVDQIIKVWIENGAIISIDGLDERRHRVAYAAPGKEVGGLY
jgi:hypothetical protein